MSFSAIILLALGLAMDATAVSAARGLATPKILPRRVNDSIGPPRPGS